MRQTKFLTDGVPTEGKSRGIGATLSSFAFSTPAFASPFLHMFANLVGDILAELVVVQRIPPFFTKGAARETKSW